jgi:hypothetical protein
VEWGMLRVVHTAYRLSMCVRESLMAMLRTLKRSEKL